MNNSQVAHLWASQNKNSARGSNFYFEGSEIYSYGPHFCIARHLGNAVLLTTRKRGNATAKHINHVRRAIPSGIPVFNVYDPTCKDAESRLEEYMERIKLAFESAKRARTPFKLEAAVQLVREFENYCKYFGFSYPFEGTEMQDIVEVSKAKITELHEKRAKQEELRKAAEIAQAQKDLAEWLDGKNKSCYSLYLLPPRLRVKAEAEKFVETSHGASVEYDKAKRSFYFIKSVWDRGETWERNGKTHYVGPFSLESIANDSVTIGCHTFERSEIERFASAEGWIA